MANWMKILLGVLVSAGIFVGVWAWVYDMHPLRDNSLYREERACWDARSLNGSTVDCAELVRPREQAIDNNEKWLGAGLGVAGAGLFWLLIYLLYIKPQRRRAEAQSPGA